MKRVWLVALSAVLSAATMTITTDGAMARRGVCMLAATPVCMAEMLIVIPAEARILPAAAIVIRAGQDGMAITPVGAAETGVVVSDGALVLQVWRSVLRQRQPTVTTAPMLPPIPTLLAAIRITRPASRISRNLSTRGE